MIYLHFAGYFNNLKHTFILDTDRGLCAVQFLLLKLSKDCFRYLIAFYYAIK